MVRGYTTIEQSCKLIELGLDQSTADMYYREWKRATKDIRIAHVGKAGKEDWPAWSLSALLELIPAGTQTHKGYNYVRIDVTFVRNGIVTGSNRVENKTYIDAAFEIVCWLIEKNILK